MSMQSANIFNTGGSGGLVFGDISYDESTNSIRRNENPLRPYTSLKDQSNCNKRVFIMHAPQYGRGHAPHSVGVR